MGDEATWKACFDKFDKDGSGEISGKELVAVLTELGHVDPDMIAGNILKACDKDSDAMVNWDEFKAGLMTE